MTIEELTKAVDEMKAQGKSEEEIAGAYYLLFRDGEINLEQLEALANHLGFELSEEFKTMDPEMQKEAGFEVLDNNGEEDGSSEPAKNNETNENEEEDKAMKFFGENKEEETSEPEETKKEENEEEDEEEKEAMKFFR